ncbi:hypothetical protein QBC35DRAFT_93393 [Podospora australis]|uniref:JmjC domain-containing protein n=1 Tax=Podospora australis TaxID=1536484 RepID=A0AAN6WKM1_9PEZI|nr:hypothetical protein QBC35DRAFT_93393 [Podospora australis]
MLRSSGQRVSLRQFLCVQTIPCRFIYTQSEDQQTETSTVQQPQIQSPVQQLKSPVSIDTFQRDAFNPGKPLLITPSEPYTRPIFHNPEYPFRAVPTWFKIKWLKDRSGRGLVGPTETLIETFGRSGRPGTLLPYELVVPSPGCPDYEQVVRNIFAFAKRESFGLPWTDFGLWHKNRARNAAPGATVPEGPSFFKFEAPITLLEAAMKFNVKMPPAQRMKQLYIAQLLISDTPQQIQNDLGTPEYVLKAGKGDVYSSSIWMGLEPTYTPFHCDPNPNLFCQLVGSKVVRLAEPGFGKHLFEKVQQEIGASPKNPAIRGGEMMQGPERKALHEAVWGEAADASSKIYEVTVRPGDQLFIPNRWWHSVKSEGDQGELNASVNWWFR